MTINILNGSKVIKHGKEVTVGYFVGWEWMLLSGGTPSVLM